MKYSIIWMLTTVDIIVYSCKGFRLSLCKIIYMRFWTYILVLGFSILLYACETKVDLVAEGEESPIVYGFLSPSADTQFVKITKSFVTEGNAFEGALDPSLSEYEDLDAWIVAWDGNDSVASYLLQEKTVTNKDSGIFYYPVQTVYYTDEIIFDDENDPQYDYDFEIMFNGSGRDVSSRTKVVGKFEPNNTQAFDVVNFVSIFNVSGSSYQDKLMIIDQSINTKRYEFTLRFHYIEKYTDGTEANKYMDFSYTPWITDGLSGTESYSFNIKGENFFQGVQSRLIAQDNEANVLRRVIRDIDYIFDFAGFDLNTFIELSKPATSFNSEQNPYSNIDNGVGVWSSRGQEIFYDKELNVKSIQELAEGQYTGPYKFCSDDPGHNDLSFGCN